MGPADFRRHSFQGHRLRPLIEQKPPGRSNRCCSALIVGHARSGY